MKTRLSRIVIFLFCLFCIAYPIAVIGVAFDVHAPFSMAWAASALLILEGTMLTVALMDEYGPRGLFAAIVIALFSYGIEVLGVGTGFPFGSYRFSGVLWPRLPGGVPLVVIFVWLLIMIAVRGLTVRPPLLMGGRWIISILMAALTATFLDLEIEPVAFHVEHYWDWLAPGHLSYYGVPLMNFVAWFVVALVLSLLVNRILLRAISFQDISSFSSRLPLNVPTWLYFANVFMFGLIDLTHGYYIAVGVAVLAAILPFVIPPLPGISPLPVIAAFGVEQDQVFQPDRKRVEQDQVFQPDRKRVKKTKKARRKRR